MSTSYHQARRRFPRATMRGTVQVNVPGGKRVTGELLTLSHAGCFVTGLPKLKVGDEYRIFLLITGISNPLLLLAKVLYNLPAMDGHEAGAGFGFTQVAEEIQPKIDEAIKRSGELYQRLLFALTETTSDENDLEQLCREAGLPDGLTTAELRWRVVQSVSQYRS